MRKVPLHLATHIKGMANPRSVRVISELKVLSASTGILTAMPRLDAFENVAAHTFPLFDGEALMPRADQDLWARLEASHTDVPSIYRKLSWCYMVFERAGETAENIVRCAAEILADSQRLISAGENRLQSAIRIPVASETRQSLR